MPEPTAIKTNNYAVMPVSSILALATIVLLFLKSFGVISVSWWVVFAPIGIWLGILLASGFIFVLVLSFVALVQIWR